MVAGRDGAPARSQRHQKGLEVVFGDRAEGLVTKRAAVRQCERRQPREHVLVIDPAPVALPHLRDAPDIRGRERLQGDGGRGRWIGRAGGDRSPASVGSADEGSRVDLRFELSGERVGFGFRSDVPLGLDIERKPIPRAAAWLVRRSTRRRSTSATAPAGARRAFSDRDFVASWLSLPAVLSARAVAPSVAPRAAAAAPVRGDRPLVAPQ